MSRLAPLLLPLAALSGAQAAATNGSSSKEQRCQPGLILPVWEPQDGLSGGDVFARALVYFFTLIYLFIGVSIVADRFMASIEVITSKEKEVTVKKPNGETQIVVVRVWNETVANLTLMALGSSAPEILLSIIEIYAKNFDSGELGPGTIVGSAAFNLFVIISLCVYVIPDGEVRKIKHLRVFFVTAAWSIFAYVWLYLILAAITPGRVDIWEAVLTLLFFPATVATAYIADRRMLFYKYMHKDYRLNKRGVIVEHEGVEMDKTNHVIGGELEQLEEEHVDESVREFEENRREYITILRQLRKKHPNMDMEQLELMAREEVLNKGPKSRAFYRIQATRKLTGGGNLMKKALQAEKKEEAQEIEEVKTEDSHIIKVFFDPGHYTVMESVGDFEVTVKREGGDPNQCVLVDYRTEDGSASAGSDYVAVAGTLFFGPGETLKTFSVAVIDDDLFEEDEHFYVKLSNLRLAERDGLPLTQTNGSAGRRFSMPEIKLAAPFVATVMILDDDHGGIFNVAEKDIEIVESVGSYNLKVVRWSGARGRVAVPFTTIEGTAKPNKDYEHTEGEVIFENNETEQYITIPIIEEDSYEKDVLFYVELQEPRYLSVDGYPGGTLDFQDKNLNDLSEEEKIALLGKPKLGESTRSQIRIKESKEFKNTVDKLVQRANASFVVGTSSWKEQFIEALTVSAGDDDDDDEEKEEGDASSEDEKLPSCGDYIMHFVTVFWKLLFAFVPPTDVYSGYPTFVFAILGIAGLTAFIGDAASHFGCTIGLRDTITAISFVALGTSVPDTFASKVAAVQDRYADASVGNVTGSNGVNVFLGIGVAWSIASIYHWATDSIFEVDPGNLAFSVTLFCCEAVLAIGLMLLRRHPRVGGELGGPRSIKIASSFFLFFLWVFYIAMSALEAYEILPKMNE
ncbi:sodium/calcium exchanger 3-like isoform X3 [Amphibalanus amphitrite]|uniref:sodium/calcium exchanger 3-like isoform X3 n=1 Tax=Amphibalanus amphitrite TaxID=1232801 RepID=UPI001C922C5C|nr:sodium/calcium exchanger 3-like isoform X3 [Amphibalanus amphitrite]XP_043215808.1 sodium/calcium exchanger 3-like isoform X3 [Amphibalanus amphitrite]